jgi:hypothetical protein
MSFTVPGYTQHPYYPAPLLLLPTLDPALSPQTALCKLNGRMAANIEQHARNAELI